VDTKEQIKVFSGVCLEDKKHFIIKSTKTMHLLGVFTYTYAPFVRFFANNKPPNRVAFLLFGWGTRRVIARSACLSVILEQAAPGFL
jgi:hypothetical protein